MTKKLLLFTFLFSNYFFAQQIRVDILDNLQYSDSGYRATLEEDLLHDFEFTDSNNNHIEIEKEYVLHYYPKALKNEKDKIALFKSFIKEHRHSYNQKVVYDIDLFDKTVIKDLRNNSKITFYIDNFDNRIYEIEIGNRKRRYSINEEGDIESNYPSFRASLKKGFANYWEYEDETGNEFTFSKETWKKLIRLHGDKEHVFFFILDNFTSY